MSKQNLKTGENSTSIQVGGDVNIQENNYLEIKEIFLDLFDLNFPKILEEAKEIVDQRIAELLKELERSFMKNKDSIEKTKFNEPAIQYEIQKMTIDVARRGKKSNLELLCELFSTLVSTDCPEIIELIASDTLKILPLLNKKHLAYLSFWVVFYELVN